MKTTIDVKDRNEGDVIKLALDDPAMRAAVVTVGLLLQLPDDAARLRVLDLTEIIFERNGHRPARLPALRLHDGATGTTGE